MINRFAKRWPGATVVIVTLGLGILCIMAGSGLGWTLDQIGIF